MPEPTPAQGAWLRFLHYVGGCAREWTSNVPASPIVHPRTAAACARRGWTTRTGRGKDAVSHLTPAGEEALERWRRVREGSSDA